jgi:geranylgeranyl pyrophosphate synthase
MKKRVIFDMKLRALARHDAQRLDHIHVQTLQALQEMVLRGGKRIRPYLCLVGYQLAGGANRKKITKIAAALELLHNYLLNLDDMADRDVVRHGGPTLEVSYQKSLFSSLPQSQRTHYARSWTEIAGAILNTYIYELIRTSGFDSETIIKILEMDLRFPWDDPFMALKKNPAERSAGSTRSGKVKSVRSNKMPPHKNKN